VALGAVGVDSPQLGLGTSGIEGREPREALFDRFGLSDRLPVDFDPGVRGDRLAPFPNADDHASGMAVSQEDPTQRERAR